MVGRVTRGSIRGLIVFALARRESSAFFYSTDYCANTSQGDGHVALQR